MPLMVYQLPRNVTDADLRKLANVYSAASNRTQNSEIQTDRVEPQLASSDRNSNAAYPTILECEFNYLNRKAKMATAYFGEMVSEN